MPRKAEYTRSLRLSAEVLREINAIATHHGVTQSAIMEGMCKHFHALQDPAARAYMLGLTQAWNHGYAKAAYLKAVARITKE